MNVKRYTNFGDGMLPDRDGMWCMVMDYDALRADRDEWQCKFVALKAAHIHDAARLLRLEGAIEDYLEGESQGNVLGLRQALEAK